jgi:epoxyqueuosine reductase
MSLSDDIKSRARQIGFDLVGICPAVTPTGATHLRRWLERGFAGEMTYMERQAAARSHPRHVLDGVRSVVMLAIAYRTTEPCEPGPLQGRISRYAWGRDYHDLIRERLRQLADFVHERAGPCRTRGVVDTAPLSEREFAQLAGLGWIGKNTMLLNKRLGSWFFLAALLTDRELDYDEPHAADHCGTCTRCLEACPTDAFAGPYQLDSRKCISYLTIELRTAIPESLREGIGPWVFGCDVCQEVCPWNRKAPQTPEPELRPEADADPVDLIDLLSLDAATFRRRFAHSALSRPRRAGLLRNAAIALGNRRHPDAVPALSRALDDPEPLIRGAAAWALGRIALPEAREALARRREVEPDDEVRAELMAALAEGGKTSYSAASNAPRSGARPT